MQMRNKRRKKIQLKCHKLLPINTTWIKWKENGNYWNYKDEAGIGGEREKLEGALAAGDRWSECMNRDADSQTQLSAGSKRERLTPTHRERETEGWQTERWFQIAAGLTVCTHSYSDEGQLFFLLFSPKLDSVSFICLYLSRKNVITVVFIRKISKIRAVVSCL